ncbi:MAG: T9SS type A sorting domain-containing protein [Salinivirgaceae bacterium]|nr:T9SS type A sorting domain-containing protein [Salinivirgaceae bacterium]
MKMKYHCLLVAILVMIAALFLGSRLQAQTKPKVKVQKHVEAQAKSESSDSVIVIVKTITDDGTQKKENIDSLVHALCPEHSGKGEKKMRIIHIENGDTVVNRCMEEPFDMEWVKAFENDSLFHRFHTTAFPGAMPKDSFNVWISRFDSLLDPLNHMQFEFDWQGDVTGLDTLIEKHLEYRMNGNNLDSMIFIGVDGENIRLERGGEMVFINKIDDIEDIDSNIQITSDENGRKVIVLQTRIVLDELTEQDKEDLKAKGITTSKQEPDFDYIKFYPNPSEQTVIIEFRLAKKANCEVRISNLLGQSVYEEKLNDFSGDYKSSVDLKKFGSGTYILQIVQGKKSISRKIIVE